MPLVRLSIQDHFSTLRDFRVERQKKHLLEDIVVLAVLSVIGGCNDWETIEQYCNSKINFLKEYFELPNGIPSHDTFRRVFQFLNPVEFEACFISWTNSRIDIKKGYGVIAIDGKSIRRSHDRNKGKKMFHMVSAYSSEQNLVLAQVKTDEKSNEITAIPELLDMIEVEGKIITIDAMGTQSAIADKIIEKQGDYILSVKENQPYLKEQVESIFSFQEPDSIDQTIEKDHGRIETRKCTVIHDLKFMDAKERWNGCKSIVKIESTRDINDQITTETRYYITSLNQNAVKMNQYVRAHWSIENSLHWVLDVQFKEDDCRKRSGFSDENFSVVRKIAFNLIKNEKSCKLGVNNKRLKAGWDNEYLLKILGI